MFKLLKIVKKKKMFPCIKGSIVARKIFSINLEILLLRYQDFQSSSYIYYLRIFIRQTWFYLLGILSLYLYRCLNTYSVLGQNLLCLLLTMSKKLTCSTWIWTTITPIRETNTWRGMYLRPEKAAPRLAFHSEILVFYFPSVLLFLFIYFLRCYALVEDFCFRSAFIPWLHVTQGIVWLLEDCSRLSKYILYAQMDRASFKKLIHITQ